MFWFLLSLLNISTWLNSLSYCKVCFQFAAMASADSTFSNLSAVEDPTKGRREAKDLPEEERPVAPDQFDPAYETTQWEIYAYYSYYIGNNGLTLFNFAPTAFQNLLSQAAGDSEVLHFAGRPRTINSIVLLANGISFALQIVIFLIIGSYAGAQLACNSMLPT